MRSPMALRALQIGKAIQSKAIQSVLHDGFAGSIAASARITRRVAADTTVNSIRPFRDRAGFALNLPR
jgi:hypothetical protein